MNEGVSEDDMLAGAGRYRKFCDATGQTGTRYVMRAATFYGPDRYFGEPYSVTPAETKVVSNGHRTYVMPDGKKIRLKTGARIHWNSPEEIRAGAINGYVTPNGSVCLNPGGRFV